MLHLLDQEYRPRAFFQISFAIIKFCTNQRLSKIIKFDLIVIVKINVWVKCVKFMWLLNEKPTKLECKTSETRRKISMLYEFPKYGIYFDNSYHILWET